MNWKKFDTGKTPTWCPGCPNYLLWLALKQSLAELKLKREKIVIAYDIGCAGNMADFIKTYGVHTLHGRAIPVAMGVKYFRPECQQSSLQFNYRSSQSHYPQRSS